MSTLYDQLRAYRKKIADKHQFSTYMVFNNKTLDHLTAFQPQTEEELLAVNGFGKKKLETYGKDVLDIIRAYVQNNPAAANQEKFAALKKLESTAIQKSFDNAYDPLNIFRASLAAFNKFSGIDTAIELKYDSPETYQDINQLYHLEEIAGTGSTFSRCTALMGYLCAHVFHNGMYDNHVRTDPIDLLDFSWDAEDKKDGLNCRFLSYILRSFFLSQNIKARQVYIFPFSPYDNENHVVVEAWLPEFNKWVMFDPTNNTYIANNEGVLLNLAEIRQALALREKIFFAPQTAYNQKTYPEDKLKELETYFAKDTFFFRLVEHQTRTPNAYSRIIQITPDGFNYEYAAQIKNWRSRDTIAKTPDFLKHP